MLPAAAAENAASERPLPLEMMGIPGLTDLAAAAPECFDWLQVNLHIKADLPSGA